MKWMITESHKTPIQKAKSTEEPEKLVVATLGGGCFWCTEAVFNEVSGVVSAEPGYSGGTLPNPTYEQVSTGTTGHAEVVNVTFDQNVVSFREILDIFFATHDPTTLNRQGADIGTQYRSVIFYHNNEQKTVAHKMIKELNNSKAYKTPIVTKVDPFKSFFKAEDYHKDYFKRNPEKSYCRYVISPKIAKLRKLLR
jgi:peptide-methionine (S)-S-oxide reductase